LQHTGALLEGDNSADMTADRGIRDLEAADDAYRSYPDFGAWSVSVDAEQYDRYRSLLQTRRSVAPDDSWQRAVDITLRSAAIDSGAIEGLYSVDRGFTYAVATEAAAWELRMEERGEHIRPLFEAQLAAFDLILDAATKRYPVTEAFVRKLHEVLTEPQATYKVLTPQGFQDQPLPKGVYKTQPNHPWRGEDLAHAYAPVAATPGEMHRLVTQLLSPEFEDAHPSIQAAYAHYALVAIHPFADGNGRVARALAAIYLFRSDSIPLLIYADQAPSYIASLEASDAGSPQEFVDFVFQRALSAMARIAETLRVSASPSPEAARARLERLTYVSPGITFPELDAAAGRFIGLLSSAIETELKALDLPPNVHGEARSGGQPSGDPGVANFRYQILNPTGTRGFRLRSDPPAEAALQQLFDVIVSIHADPPLLQIRQQGTSAFIEASISEMHPEPTEDLTYRLALFVRAGIYEKLSELTEMAEGSLRAKGFQPND
jgi:hypothetical protein